MNKYKVIVDGRDCTKQVPFPIKFSQLLDEQLDEASISIIRTKRKVIAPLTPVSITIWNDENALKTTELTMIVASDKTDEVPVGSGLYNHELYLIEETKLLEGFLVRSHGYVNSLQTKSGEYRISPVVDVTSSSGFNDLPLPAPTNDGEIGIVIDFPVTVGETITIPAVSTLFGNRWVVNGVVQDENFATITIRRNNDISNTYLGARDAIEYTFSAEGTYQIIYDYSNTIEETNSQGGSISSRSVSYTATYTIVVGNQSISPLPNKWTALSVCRRVFDIAETLRKGDIPRFKLEGDNLNYIGNFASESDLPTGYPIGTIAWIRESDTDKQDGGYTVKVGYDVALDKITWTQDFEATGYPLSGTAKRLEFIETPEFQFTQSTLREILQGIGDFIHAEPRLKNGVVSYDFYGSNELSEPLHNYASVTHQQQIDRYSTSIDSSVDNIVNSLSYAEGVFIEPFDGGAKSLRTENLYARIEDGNSIILTTDPIDRIYKVEFYEVSSKRFYDITKYVFESADYSQLSSYIETYPYSKAFGIYYTRGEKGIKGLWLRLPDAIDSSYFKKYTIENIINSVCGSTSYSVGPSLMFRVTYSPMYKSRILQSKSCILDLNYPRTIAYNQGQNIVEAKYYGEHLKGVIARLGNVDKTITTVYRGLADIPKIGTLYNDETDDYYISAVAAEINPSTTKISMSLSKDFNRYSDYISLSSVKRQYEISEKQAYDSHINYRDYCVIGDDNDIGRALYSMRFILDAFIRFDGRKIGFLVAQGGDRLGNKYQRVLLPVHSFAQGNSAVFSASYTDNYSAGNNSIYQSEGNVTGYFTNGVPYSDVYGNLEYLTLEYGCKIGFEQEENEDAIASLALALPALSDDYKITEPTPSELITTARSALVDPGYQDEPLLIRKGSTEIPTITYQIDFVSNRRSLVIGSAMASHITLITPATDAQFGGADLYILPRRLNKFENKPSLKDAIFIASAAYGSDQALSTELIDDGFKDVQAVFHDRKVPDGINGSAWALVDKKTGDLLVGENKPLNPGDWIFSKDGRGLWFTAVHDIFEGGLKN